MSSAMLYVELSPKSFIALAFLVASFGMTPLSSAFSIFLLSPLSLHFSLDLPDLDLLGLSNRASPINPLTIFSRTLRALITVAL